jgi:hypothetical protein
VSDSTARAIRSSTEKENTYGKTDRISEPKNYYFTVWEDIFAHCPTMGGAIWLFLWYIARTTREENGVGAVLGDTPILDARPANELHVSVKTVRRWRLKLVKGKFVDSKRTAYGHRITLPNSRKWRSKRDARVGEKPEAELPQMATRSGPERAAGSDRNGQNKVESKERAQETRAVRSPSDSDDDLRTACSPHVLKRKAKPRTLEENLAKHIQEHFSPIETYFQYDARVDGDRAKWLQSIQTERRQWSEAADWLDYSLDLSDPCVCVEFLDKLFDKVMEAPEGADRATRAKVCMKVIDGCRRDEIPYPPTFLAHKTALWARESRRTIR